MLLSRGLHRQSKLYRRNIEGKVVQQGKRIKELEEELETMKKKREDEKATRKTTENAAAKLRKELKEEQKARETELSSFASSSQEVMAHCHDCLHGVGADTKFSDDCTLTEFMTWLCGEMNTLEGHMMLGRDFAAITAFKVICTSLLEAGCDHLGGLTVQDVDHYWHMPLEPNDVGKKFFDEFWLLGGNDMAIMKGACSRGQTPKEKKAIKGLVSEFLAERRHREAEWAGQGEASTPPIASPTVDPESSAVGANQGNEQEGVDA